MPEPEPGTDAWIRDIERLHNRPGIDFPLRPELRIRDDAPSIEVTEATLARDALDSLSGELDGVVMRDESGEAKAVVLTPERYAELAGYEVERAAGWMGAPPGHPQRDTNSLVPRPEVVKALMIEQVDPKAKWDPVAQVWPPRYKKE